MTSLPWASRCFELNQQADGRFLPGFGGDVSNVAIAAARLGARTAIVTKLGSDPFGDAIEELWRREVGRLSERSSATRRRRRASIS